MIALLWDAVEALAGQPAGFLTVVALPAFAAAAIAGAAIADARNHLTNRRNRT